MIYLSELNIIYVLCECVCVMEQKDKDISNDQGGCKVSEIDVIMRE